MTVAASTPAQYRWRAMSATFVLMLVMVFPLVAQPDQRSLAAPRTVRMLLNSGFTGANAWLLLADARGYFRAEGLTVEFTPGRGAFTAAARIDPEGFDFGFGDINAVIEEVSRNRDRAPIGIFMLFNRSPSAIILPAGSRINSPKQLEGRTIIGHATDVARNTFAASAARTGIDTTRVKIVADSSGWAALLGAMEQGRADAVFEYLTTSTAAVEQMKRDVASTLRFLPFRDVVPELYGSTLMASRSMVSGAPDVVRAFLRAANRGLVDAVADPAAALTALAVRDPAMSRAVERNRMLGTFGGDMGAAEGRTIGIGDVDTTRLATSIAMVTTSRGLARRPSHTEVFSRNFLPPLAARVTTLGAAGASRD